MDVSTFFLVHYILWLGVMGVPPACHVPHLAILAKRGHPCTSCITSKRKNHKVIQRGLGRNHLHWTFAHLVEYSLVPRSTLAPLRGVVPRGGERRSGHESSLGLVMRLGRVYGQGTLSPVHSIITTITLGQRLVTCFRDVVATAL